MQQFVQLSREAMFFPFTPSLCWVGTLIGLLKFGIVK